MSASGNNMNCEDYKTAITAEPSAESPAAASHVADCPSCQAFRAEIEQLDARIAKALAFDAPALAMPELPPIAADNVVRMPARSGRRLGAPAWIGIAASFALAAVIAVQFTADDHGAGESLAAEILAHIDHEPGSLRATNAAVGEDALARVLQKSGSTMNHDIGLITYAQSCVINGHTIPHLVIQGENGPVTLLLMPEEMVDGAIRIEGVGVNGVILPVGNGSIAIVGERDEPLDRIEQRVIDSVEWSI